MITAFVAAFDAKALNCTDLLKSYLAGGNRIFNCHRRHNSNIWQNTRSTFFIRITSVLSYICSKKQTHCTQARRLDLAAGGAKNKMEVPKTRRGGHIFEIQYWMYAATGRSNVKWGSTDFKWGGRAPLAPPLATALTAPI